MGIADVKRHLESEAHKSMLKTFDCQRSVKTFATTDDTLSSSVIEAEARASMFLCHHNLPLSTLDHLGPLMRSMFPDSKIAAKFRCGRTKTSAIVNAIGPEYLKVTEEAMKVRPFSICTDGSNDNGLFKLNPMLIHQCRLPEGSACIKESSFISRRHVTLPNLSSKGLTRGESDHYIAV